VRPISQGSEASRPASFHRPCRKVPAAGHATETMNYSAGSPLARKVQSGPAPLVRQPFFSVAWAVRRIADGAPSHILHCDSPGTIGSDPPGTRRLGCVAGCRAGAGGVGHLLRADISGRPTSGAGLDGDGLISAPSPHWLQPSRTSAGLPTRADHRRRGRCPNAL